MSIHEALTSKDVSALTAFLASPERPAGTPSYHELQGFIFAITSAPDLIRPSEWLPLVFKDSDAGYVRPEEAQETLSRVLALYNQINGATLDGAAALPADCGFREQVMANLDEDAPVAQWSRGFLLGHQHLEALWDAYLPEALDEDFGATVMTLSFFSSRRLAETYAAESTRSDDSNRPESVEQLASALRELFPKAVSLYAQLGRSIHEARMTLDSEDRNRPARSTKVGRNQPCPCGSGKKYKKCCGASVH